MATNLPDIVAKVRLDTSTLNSGVGKANKSMSALKVGAAVAAGGIALAFRTGFREVEDYQAGLAQANAVIKSTGGEAHVTSKHVEDLAGSIQGYSGQTDDSIVSGENLLLTFTNIRNQTGKNNDIFDQSTKILADMSQALGQDTKTSAIQLGKALNDPIKGVTALQRVGVSFTEDQKKQIKQMVKSGDTMGAQKLILGELNKEFGGSAAAYGKTMPGQIARSKRAFEDLTQSLVVALLPAFTTLTTIVRNATQFFTAHEKVLGPLVGIVLGLGGAIFAISKAVKIWREAQIALNIVLAANPIILIVLALAALAVGLYEAWKHSETFRAVVTGAFHAVADAAKTAFNAVKNAILTAFNAVKSAVTKSLHAIQTAWSASWNACRAVVTSIFHAISSVVMGAFHGITSGAHALVSGVTGAFHGLTSAVTGVAHAIEGVFKAAWNGIATAWNSTVGALTFSIPGWVPLIGGHGWSVPDIPTLARGAVTAGPTLALIGDNPGGRERVQPLGADGMTTGERAILAALRGNASTNVGQLVIQNPKPERASDSLYHTVQKLAYGL